MDGVFSSFAYFMEALKKQICVHEDNYGKGPRNPIL